MVESVESRLKKLEKERAGAADPVTFTVYTVQVDDDGTVWRKDVSTGRRHRVKPSTVAVVPWAPSEKLIEMASRPRPAPETTSRAVPAAPEPTPEEQAEDAYWANVESVRQRIAEDGWGTSPNTLWSVSGGDHVV